MAQGAQADMPVRPRRQRGPQLPETPMQQREMRQTIRENSPFLLNDIDGPAAPSIRSLTPTEAGAGATATVDLGAVHRNYLKGKAHLAPDVIAAAVVKADGYGLGATEMAKTLMAAGCRDFFVARITEAVELRKALDAEMPNSSGQVAIMVLDGTLHGADPLLLVQHGITPVLNSVEQVKTWNDAARQVGRPLPAFLQFDTGMHRAGMHEKDAEAVASANDEMLQGLLKKRDELLSHIDVQCVMTHLACADDAETVPGAAPDAPRRAGEASRKQLERFNEIAKEFPGAVRSPGASTTVLLEPEFHGGMVRMGGTFHGQAPFADMNPYENVLTLTSTVAQTRVVPPGGGVGYGHTFVAEQSTTIATLPEGYADGLPRVPAGNPGPGPDTRPQVLLAGQAAPLAGKVSMDMTTVDVSRLDPALHAPGTPVTLMGKDMTPDQFGAMYGTNPSETLTKLTSRVPRQYVPSKEPPVEAGPSRFAWGGALRPAATDDVSLRRQAILHARDTRLTKEASGAVATVDLGAMRRNINVGIERLKATGTEPGVVLKADGYGLGAVKLAKVLIEEGVKDLFVARLSEAIDLRQGLRKEIPAMADKVAVLILDGILPGADTDTMVKLRLTPVLNSLDQVKDWNAAGRRHGVALPAFLQVDSGMNRAGMHADDVQALVANQAEHLSHIKLQTVMTHLAKADDAVDEQRPDRSRDAGALSRQQLAAFEAICANFPGVKKSPGASTTLFLEPEFRGDMVRMGATFHGQAPFDADSNPLEPTVKLETKVAQDRVVPQGGSIGYGHTYTAPEDMPVLTIPIGYADGMPRIPAGNRPGDAPTAAKVIIDGVAAPLVGKVSMDMTTVDARNVPEASRRAGTPVTVIGEGVTPDHFGAMYGTNASEVQTKLTRRVFRDYVDTGPTKPVDTKPSSNAWGSLEKRPA
ncbi:MAG TPA: alanine racemase [Methylibium sp.]|uniref:alanine racemase n=1 Tax=Methylibium sp. TaxID=2067992 RepID=UPI002DBAA560|nr:alanine racemase [Methylibium sp.]HEU4460087.1 alanine racemase [Methylibium sp.]